MRRYLLIASLMTLPTIAAAPPPPTTAAAVDHVAIYVQDAKRSAAFYKGLFGLRQVKAAVPVAIWLALSNGTMLHIIPGRTTPVDNPKWDHLALACDDMPAMIARLAARGIPWGRHGGPPEATGAGGRGPADLCPGPGRLLGRNQRRAQAAIACVRLPRGGRPANSSRAGTDL